MKLGRMPRSAGASTVSTGTADFVAFDVARLADELGHSPIVEIRGHDVFLTLGLDAPQILTEGDFDFGDAVDAVMSQEVDEDDAEQAFQTTI